MGGPAGLATFAAGSAVLGAVIGCVLGDFATAGAPWLSLPVGGGGGMEAPLLVGRRSASGAAPGLCGLRRPLGDAGRHLEPLALLGQGARTLAQEEGRWSWRHFVGECRAGRSEALPVQPRAQLSQRVDLGEGTVLQKVQGRDPGSKVLHQLHSAYPDGGSCMRWHMLLQQGVGTAWRLLISLDGPADLSWPAPPPSA